MDRTAVSPYAMIDSERGVAAQALAPPTSAMGSSRPSGFTRLSGELPVTGRTTSFADGERPTVAASAAICQLRSIPAPQPALAPQQGAHPTVFCRRFLLSPAADMSSAMVALQSAAASSTKPT
jgi:hypothetical protein